MDKSLAGDWLEHPQAPVPKSPGVEVDITLVPLINWCATNNIRTLASCQGGERERAYVLFASLGDLERFFHRLTDLVASAPNVTKLLGRVKDVSSERASSSNWTYEARPSAPAMRNEPGAGMWGIVRLPATDLVILNTVLDSNFVA